MAACRPLRTKVRGPDGHSVARARLWIEGASAPVPDIAALSDDRGEAVMSVPASGGFTIVCAADGFGTKRITVAASAGAPTELVIDLLRDP